MRTAVRCGGWLAAGLAAVVGSARAEAPATCATIRSVEVRGAVKMSADAVRFDLGVKPGAAWDEEQLRREFRRFLERGYFADLRFFRRCTDEGAVVVVELKERPTLLAVSYDKSKDVSQTDLEDYYKQRNFSLTAGAPLDRKKLWRAETLIKEVLGQRGFMDAQVAAEIKQASATSAAVHFRIRAGGKTRIRALDFTGNAVFSDRRLRRQLKLVRPWRWWWPFSRTCLYHPLKYQQDITNVVQHYKDQGYLDADVRPPIVNLRAVHPERAEAKARRKAQRQAVRAERRRAKLARRGEVAAETAPPAPEVRTKKWVHLSVPVEEGRAYRLGEIKVEGAALLKPELIRALIPLRDGAVLADGLLEFGLKNIRSAYGNQGYVYAAVTRRYERRGDAEGVADVVVTVDEDQPYTVRRIEFAGNAVTHDEVLRRELNVHEGELLSQAQLDRSVQKLRMLGFWLPGDEPALQPVPDRAELDIKVQGEEQSRNEVQIGGGYSELEGGFFLGSFQTSNLLGRGERLNLYAAVGGRASRASISFTEPWFMGRPYTVGFQLFRRSYDFGVGRDATGASERLSQTSTGGGLVLGKRLGDFSRIQLGYDYQTIRADTLDISSQFAATRTRLGILAPLFFYGRVDNPLRPMRGFEFRLGSQVASTLLGGEANYWQPSLSTSVYRPVFRPIFLAAHLEAGFIQPFGGVLRKPGYVDGAPRFERFFLGGDTIGPRVFESRTISPVRAIVSVDANGAPVTDGLGNPILVPAYVGGNKQLLLQFECGLPIGKTATLAAFFDAGGVYDNGQSINAADMRLSTGIEFRVFLPVFQAPIRLIYGWPVREHPGDRVSRFQFSVGLPF